MSINLDRVSDAQTVAEKLTGLPKKPSFISLDMRRGAGTNPPGSEGKRRRPTEKKRPAPDGAEMKRG